MINGNWDEPLMNEMAEYFGKHEPKSFYWTHYELARQEGTPTTDPQDWKRFVTNNEVSDYISQELRLLQQGEMRKLLQNISGNARSVGTAQSLTAMMKFMDTTGVKEGPAMIYCYVPLNEQEIHAPNVQVLDHDPFRRNTHE